MSIKGASYNCWKLVSPDKKNVDFVNKLYLKEEYPIFEQNFYNIFSYLRFHKELYGIETKSWQSILIKEENLNSLFTPSLEDISEFVSDLKTMPEFADKEISIINVSKQWVDLHCKNLEKLVNKLEIKERSKTEAVYDLELLNKLQGGEFSKLRYVRNKLLLTNKITFKPIDLTTDVENAKSLIEKWNQVQGFKYSKDKKEKEKFVIDCLTEYSKENNNLKIEMGIVDQKVLCVVAYFLSPTHPQWSEIYIVKGINRAEDGGMHGVSDAAYLHIFSELKKMGAIYANDGELGTEEGTKNHKLGFKPVRFLQSYDLRITI